MNARNSIPIIGLTLTAVALAGVTTASANAGPMATIATIATIAKWPPWLSIESPVNPYEPSARGALFLIHAAVRESVPRLQDISGSAEGLVAGARRSIVLRIDTTSRPGVFAVRRQWPTEGTWLLRISLLSTTALITMDRVGKVAGVRVPTELSSGTQVPRGVPGAEIDSMLADAVKR